MPITKKTSKNQVTIPKEIVQKFPGVDYFEVSSKGREITLRPVKLASADDALEAVRDKIARLGIKKRDIDEAIRWARKK